MRQFIMVLSLAGFALSCSRQEKMPKDVVSKEKMGTVLFEISMAETRLENYTFRDSTVNRDSALKVELDRVLLVNQLSQDLFRSSYDYYKMRPEQMKEIIDTVYSRSQRSQDKLYGLRRKGRSINVDSIQKKFNVPK
jgi:Domain of unknown function (DUF4296)